MCAGWEDRFAHTFYAMPDALSIDYPIEVHAARFEGQRFSPDHDEFLGIDNSDDSADDDEAQPEGNDSGYASDDEGGHAEDADSAVKRLIAGQQTELMMPVTYVGDKISLGKLVDYHGASSFIYYYPFAPYPQHRIEVHDIHPAKRGRNMIQCIGGAYMVRCLYETAAARLCFDKSYSLVVSVSICPPSFSQHLRVQQMHAPA